MCFKRLTAIVQASLATAVIKVTHGLSCVTLQQIWEGKEIHCREIFSSSYESLYAQGLEHLRRSKVAVSFVFFLWCSWIFTPKSLCFLTQASPANQKA